jgi:hypothetical protein
MLPISDSSSPRDRAIQLTTDLDYQMPAYADVTRVQ